MILELQWLTLKKGQFPTATYVDLIKSGSTLDDAINTYGGMSLLDALKSESKFPPAKLAEILRDLGENDVDDTDDSDDKTHTQPEGCDKIENIQGWLDFEEALLENKITDTDWELCKGIPTKQINKIRSFVKHEATLDWDGIAEETTQDLKETSKSTDIYFIGATSAGKSCILAALSNRIKDSGDMVLNEDASLPGMQYTNYLSLCRDVQCLPDATGKGVALATSFDVYHNGRQGKTRHSWNFVEMAGERVYQLARQGEFDAINANGWMDKRNAKIINFVVDPSFDASERGMMQDALMNQAFIALSKSGVFAKTTLVNILVNKFDLECQEKSIWNAEALRFVQDKFSPLVNSLKEVQYKKGFFGSKKLFEIHVIPFSIGNDFSFSRYVHNWDWDSTDHVIDVLKQNTPHG